MTMFCRNFILKVYTEYECDLSIVKKWRIIMRKLRYLSVMLATALILTACSQNGTTTNSSAATTASLNTGTVDTATASDTSNTETVAAVDIDDFDDEDYDTSWDEKTASTVTFSGTSAAVTGNNVTVSGSTVTINGPGTFVISGDCSDGNIIVEDTTESGLVHIVLNGVSIKSTTTAPIFVKSADKTVITLAKGTQNTLEDASEYVYASDEETEPSAALYSKDDLTINGEGTLTVNANLGDAIQSKDDLKIAGGIINITSTDDGLIGKDSVQISDGTVTINSQGDGIKSTNDSDTEKGNVVLYGGTLTITAGADGIQAENQLLVHGGTYTITTGGGSQNSSKTAGKDDGPMFDRQRDGNQSGTTQSDTGITTTSSDTETTSDSTKGLKAGNVVNIDSGEFTINSLDDAIHSNGDATISGGTFNISTGDDGVHADNELNLIGGTVTINNSYEGLEALTINFKGGTYKITASDDGLNAADGNSSSSSDGKGNMNSSSTNATLNISGGNLWVDAGGDGLDSNGSINMSGGTVFVNGPTNGGNGALDYDASFDITGGTLVAVGAVGMAQSPSTTSAQPSVTMTFSSSQAADSVVYLTDSAGNNIVTFAPSKTYQSVIISSPDLKSGSTYTLSTKESSDLGDNELHINETYNSGTDVVTFELSDGVTYVNESGVTTSNEGDTMGGGGFGGGKGDRGRGNFNSGTNADGSTMQMPADGQTPPERPSNGNE